MVARVSAPTSGSTHDSMETLECAACGTEWTRAVRRGRKPSLCPDCNAGGSPSPDVSAGSVRERNRALAAALRDAGKEPTGDTWARAKDMVATGATVVEAAAWA